MILRLTCVVTLGEGRQDATPYPHGAAAATLGPAMPSVVVFGGIDATECTAGRD
jgi:hypothetical protein